MRSINLRSLSHTDHKNSPAESRAEKCEEECISRIMSPRTPRRLSSDPAAGDRSLWEVSTELKSDGIKLISPWSVSIDLCRMKRNLDSQIKRQQLLLQNLSKIRTPHSSPSKK